MYFDDSPGYRQTVVRVTGVHGVLNSVEDDGLNISVQLKSRAWPSRALITVHVGYFPWAFQVSASGNSCST